MIKIYLNYRTSCRRSFYHLEDINAQLRDYQDKIYINPEELQTLRERVDMIQSLQNKYGSTVKDILNYLEASKREHEGIEISSEEAERNQTKYTNHRGKNS